MADNDSDNRYTCEPDFDEDNRDPVVPISVSDSTELWLIQWPVHQLQPTDFHRKDLCLKLHRNGKLASFENSSGKSYDIVSFAAQEPNATVFLPSSSNSKVVGKISRRVCLVRYPEPGEFDKPGFNNPNSSGLKLEGSKITALSHLPTIPGIGSQPGTDASCRETLTSGHSSIKHNIPETSLQQSKKRKHRSSFVSSEHGSHVTVGSAQLNGEKSKKRKIKVQ